jgi:hypothetical protein
MEVAAGSGGSSKKPASRRDQLMQQLPGYAGMIRLNGQTLPHAYVSLNRPTGKYVHRALLKIASVLLDRGGVRTVGHPGAPGMTLPLLDADRGFAQIPIWPKGYSAVAVNVIGHPSIREAVTVPAEPFMLLDLDPTWHSIEDYLAAMKTKYRTRARRVQTLSAHCSLTECTDWPDADWLDWAGELLGKTLADKAVALPDDLRGLLATFKRVYGADFHVLGYQSKGQWVGFITALQEGDCLFAMHMGFEPEFAREEHFYQRSMMDVVDLGIRLRATGVNMGRTATEIKSSLGAKPQANSYVFIANCSWMRWLVSGYLRWFHRLPAYEVRSPFRES